MDIRELPKMLANKFGRVVSATETQMILEVPGTNFWLKWVEMHDHTQLRFFDSEYSLKQDFGIDHFAEIMAGAFDTGVWAYGGGTQMSEGLRVDFRNYPSHNRFDSMYPQIQFFSVVLTYADSLLRGIPFETDTFWLNERMEAVREFEEGGGG